MTINEPIVEAEPQSQDLAARVSVSRELGTRQRDELLHELVVRYRAGDRSTLGPLIVELLQTYLRIRVSRYTPIDPSISVEDIYQKLVMEVLNDALTIPLQGARFLERRLAMRSADRVSRWLQREQARQARSESLEVWVAENERDEEDDEDA